MEDQEYERIRSAYWVLCIFLQGVGKNLSGTYDCDQVEVAKIARRALDNVGIFFEFTSQTPKEYTEV